MTFDLTDAAIEEIQAAVNTMLEDLAKQSNMKIGEVVKHPDGRNVKVVEGHYLDPVFKRVTNFWYWREVLPNGELGSKECGYGW